MYPVQETVCGNNPRDGAEHGTLSGIGKITGDQIISRKLPADKISSFHSAGNVRTGKRGKSSLWFCHRGYAMLRHENTGQAKPGVYALCLYDLT